MKIDDDWEIDPEPTRVADYLVFQPTRWSEYQKDGIFFYKATFPVGSQPESSVMIPGSEREAGE